jgi:hypothetical protein
MHSLKSQQGVLEINHRYSPGVPEEVMVKLGMPKEAGKKDSVVEYATFTCADCQKVVIINPKRTRPRGYCPKCNHYICDECEAIRFASGGVCRNFNNAVDAALNRIAKDLQAQRTSSTFGSSLILP